MATLLSISYGTLIPEDPTEWLDNRLLTALGRTIQHFKMMGQRGRADPPPPESPFPYTDIN